MPIVNQNVGATSPKTGTFQFSAKRYAGVTLKIPTASVVTSITTRRLVSLQEDTNQNLVAVPYPAALVGYTIVGWGVLEEALQSGGLASIAPTPNTLVDGDTVVVLRDPDAVCMVDVDPSNKPTEGIGTAYMDVQGRITSVSSGANIALAGAVFKSVPGPQMSSQLAASTVFYMMYTPNKL